MACTKIKESIICFTPKHSAVKGKPSERKSWAKLQVKLIFADDFVTGKKFKFVNLNKPCCSLWFPSTHIAKSYNRPSDVHKQLRELERFYFFR